MFMQSTPIQIFTHMVYGYINTQYTQGQIQVSQKGGHKYIAVNMIIVCGAHILACKVCQI